MQLDLIANICFHFDNASPECRDQIKTFKKIIRNPIYKVRYHIQLGLYYVLR